jgi:hypothetical protein
MRGTMRCGEIRQFVTFHRLHAPPELGPEAVKEYLEYLDERGNR